MNRLNKNSFTYFCFGTLAITSLVSLLVERDTQQIILANPSLYVKDTENSFIKDINVALKDN